MSAQTNVTPRGVLGNKAECIRRIATQRAMSASADGIASTSADVAVNMGCVFSRSELLAVVMRS